MEFLQITDFIGLFAFAITGVLAAMRKDLDFVGAMFCGFATALGGGIIRDSILGIPSATFADHDILIFVLGTIILGYFLAEKMLKIEKIVRMADAIGLASFVVVGTQKALEIGTPVIGAVLLGVLTGVGGGIIREISLQKIPVLFQKELYALGAFLGATGFAVFQANNFFSLEINLAVWALFILIFRLITIQKNLHLPIKKLKR